MTLKYHNRSVMPSYLGTKSMGGTSRSPMQSDTVQLMLGEVKEIIPVSSAKSLSKKYLEYTVEVQYRDPNACGPVSIVTFSNVLLINSLAGVADQTHFTLRSDDSLPKGDEVNTTGAKVLLLCVQGNAGQAFIIGGVREDKGTDANEHKYSFEFNGVQMDINKDGEFQIRYRGATKINGDLTDDANADAEGSTIFFDKDGGIQAYTKDKKQFIYIDHANKKIDVLADDEWHVKVNKKLSFEMGDTCTITGKSSCTIEMSDKVFIKSAGVHVGNATDSWPLFSTYRQSESTMHQTLSQSFTQLSTAIGQAAMQLQLASVAHKVPIAGPIAGSVPLQLAATALTSCVALLTAMGTAITTFEGPASTYLSTKNKND